MQLGLTETEGAIVQMSLEDRKDGVRQFVSEVALQRRTFITASVALPLVRTVSGSEVSRFPP